jgi:DNA segregation ATPase FtsK/SpoIIIE, S-DNA-T family
VAFVTKVFGMAKRKPRKKTFSMDKVSRDLSDERIPKLIGLLCFFLAIYLFIAFISYCFTWKADQDLVFRYSWNILTQRDLNMENWLGRLGAVVSHQFFYWGFGVASFAFIYFLVQLGRKLFQPFSVNIFKTTQDTVLILFIGAPFLHFAFTWFSGFPFGGSFGKFVVEWLDPFIGTPGLVLLFIFVFAGISVWYRSPALQYFSRGTFLSKISFRKSTQVAGDKEINNNKNSHDNKNATKYLVEDDFDMVQPASKTTETTKSESLGKEAVIQGQSLILDGQTELDLKITDEPGSVDKDSLEVEIATPKEESVVQNYIEDVQMEEEEPLDLEPYDPTKELSRYRHPDLELLENYDTHAVEIDRAELEANKNQIVSTLSNYKIEITKIRATIGPTVTLYEIVPAPGVRISKIKNLEDDIALSLSALGIRIIAPIPGKGTIGIEVPNKKKQIVSLKEVLKSDKFTHANMELPIALGKTIANEVFVADLSKMPHLLIAGATGQGKSVGINAILMSLLFKKHPSQIKLVLIDPKKVELSIYSKLEQHFLAFLPDEEEPIITETKKVINTLNSLCLEMDSRYELLKKANARNILEYNTKFIARRLNPEKGHQYLPYIVLVVDEFADLIMTAGKEVEMPIARLAQLARAIGIHLIIATQRPSVNIITGVIKANFPARIAFKVTSGVDSKTILDRSGADQLIGRGDMLLSIGGDTIRLQCAFVDTPEVERTIEAIAEQKGYPTPFYLPEYIGADDDGDGPGSYSAQDLDENFDDAARLVVQNQQGSTSMIQRRLKLGYNRAGRIMDQLEAFGVVGPNEGSKAREVLIHDEFDLERHLEQIRKQKSGY